MPIVEAVPDAAERNISHASEPGYRADPSQHPMGQREQADYPGMVPDRIALRGVQHRIFLARLEQN